MIEQYNGVERPALKHADHDGCGYYLLNDGRLVMLLEVSNAAVIFTTEAIFHSWRKSAMEQSGHPLKSLPKRRDRYFDFLDNSVQVLSGFTEAPMPYSYDSLRLIDEQLRKRKTDYWFYKDALYLHVAVFATQCVIEEEKAELQLHRDSETGILEPFIQLQNGRQIQVFTDLDEYAYEDFSGFSVLEITKLRLNSLSDPL